MKAVLVIDMPNEAKIEEYRIAYVVYHLHECGKSVQGIGVSLRPLPQMKVGDDLYERYGSWTPSDEKEAHYRVGFNDCLEEIMGETE